MPAQFWTTSLLALLLGIPGAAVSAEPIRTDYAMLSDPDIAPIDVVREFDPRCIPLWSLALKRPEVDYQRLTADTICRAHAAGMPGLTELLPELRALAANEKSTPAVRYSAIRALAALEDRESAGLLLTQSQHGGLHLRQLVEPILARWDHAPARTVWQQRLSDAKASRSDLLLAIRGLETVADAAATPALLALVRPSDGPADVRRAAAAAAGQCTTTGLESEVETLRKTPNLVGNLCAVALLQRHDSPTTRELLAQLSAETEPSVAWQALARLLAIDPNLVVPLAEAAMQNADPEVRRQGLETYLALATPERVSVVGRLLDDVHPDLRGRVRDQLVTLAKQPELEDAVRVVARQVLAQPGWRGQEQALLVLGALDDEPSARGAIALLESPRREVRTTAAWMLRKVAVADTLPELLAYATRKTQGRAGPDALEGRDEQIAHLLELFGILQYREADELLRSYIPLDLTLGIVSRPAAIWALGKLHVGEYDAALSQLLLERIQDQGTMPPESSEVRQMSAVALTWMQAKPLIDDLKAHLGPNMRPYREPLVFRWAIMQLTGEPLPEALPEHAIVGDWYLRPISLTGAAQ